MDTDLFSVQDKRVVVTGAGRGLGRAMATGFARAGADLALLARSKEQLDDCAAEIRALGRDCLVLPTDVTREEQVARSFADIDSRSGRVDVLVCNAGTNIRKTVGATGFHEWQTVLQTNLDSAFLCARAAMPLLQKASDPRVILIGSVAGLVAIPTGVAYAASKAALSQMARSLAQEWGPEGIKVNCIAPWYFRTPLTEPVLSKADYLERVLRITPLRRVGEEQDIVGTALFLAAPASAYVTGQTIALDGGMSTSAFHPGPEDPS